MSEALAVYNSANLAEGIEKILITGDLNKLTPEARVQYYNAVCSSLGLNPLTRPFDYLNLNNKLVLYARKDCADQLRRLYGVSVVPPLASRTVEGIYIVEATVQDATGRTDIGTGAVSLGTLKGEALANALMKAETKAKRRATLSLIGLGMLDETEIETIRDARKVRVNDSGEVEGEYSGGMDSSVDDLREKEMVFDTKRAEATRESIAADPYGTGDAVPASAKVITVPQRKRMFAVGNENDWTEEELRYLIALSEYGGYDSTAKITTDHYDKIIAALESYDEHAKVHDLMNEQGELEAAMTGVDQHGN